MGNEQTTPPLVATPSVFRSPRHSDARRLKQWFLSYLALWIGTVTIAAIFGGSDSSYLLVIIPALLCSLLVCYVVSIVYAYKVQKELYSAGLYKHGAWQVIVGAIILNPFFFGALIPASVLWVNRRITKGARVPRYRR